MNTLDTFILIPLLIGFIFGFFKGFIREVLGLAVVFFGIYGAKWFSPIISSILTGVFSVSEQTAKPLSFVLMFITIAIVLMILARSLHKFAESISLGGLNKLMGGIFGLLKYALIVSLLLIVLNAVDTQLSFLNAQTKNKSILYKPMLNLAPDLWAEVKEVKAKNTDKD